MYVIVYINICVARTRLETITHIQLKQYYTRISQWGGM